MEGKNADRRETKHGTNDATMESAHCHRAHHLQQVPKVSPGLAQ